MADEVVLELVLDGLWQRVQPLLPQHPPRCFRHPGRFPRDDRAALAGIVHVLITGCTWGQVPTAQPGCLGVTCWRRLRIRYEVRADLHLGLLQLASALIYHRKLPAS